MDRTPPIVEPTFASDPAGFILEHVSDGYVLVDRSFRIVAMNRAAEAMHGDRPRAEVIGQTHWEAWPAALGTRMETEYRNAMSERVPAHFEWHRHGVPDGGWLEIQAYPAGDGLALFYRDISRRKRSEAELRAAVAARETERAHMTAAIDNLPAAMIVADALSGRVLAANQRVAEIWPDGGGTANPQGPPPEGGQRHLPGDWPLARAVATGQTIRNERVQIRRADGTVGVILASAAPIRDEAGAITSGVIIFEDVTEVERLERTLEVVGERLENRAADWEALFNLIPAGIAVGEGADCASVRVNRAFAQILGVSTESNVSSAGPNADRLPFRALRHGRVLQAGELPLQAAARLGERVVGQEVDLEFADGRRVSLLADAVPLFAPDGAVRGAVGAFTDVTEQLGRERSTRLLADVSATLAHSLELEPTLRTVARLVVPELADWCVVDLCGSGGMRRVAVEHRDPALREVARIVQDYPPVAGRGNLVMEVCSTGNPLVVSQVDPGFVDEAAIDGVQASALRMLGVGSFIIVPLAAHGQVHGTITLVRGRESTPLTERDQPLLLEIASRAALAVANALLYSESQRLSQAKSELVAATSHELRTPLNAIIGYASLLRDGITGPLTATQNGQLGRITAAATHLLKLIDEILTLSRIDAGKHELALERADLVATLRETAALAEPSAAAKGLAFGTELPPEPVPVLSDLTKLRQIVLNLLSNAVKFTSHGSVVLHAAVRGEDVEISVRDTGQGIAPEHLDRVFEPFFQEDQRNTGQASGTGLGLAVSRNLARLMDGDLSLTSAPGAGTTVVLRLPLVGRHSPPP